MSRRDIYYWKCDRPAAFHGTQKRDEANAELEKQLHEELRCHFDAKKVDLKPGAGQGNHLTWNADVDGIAMFVRVENGPEQDGHLAIESAVLDRVREIGVLSPRVYACDATRSHVPFAWQSLERIAAPDKNHWFKQGTLEVPRIAFEIGQAVAKWQEIAFEGFGILEWSALRSREANLLCGTKAKGRPNRTEDCANRAARLARERRHLHTLTHECFSTRHLALTRLSIRGRAGGGERL